MTQNRSSPTKTAAIPVLISSGAPRDGKRQRPDDDLPQQPTPPRKKRAKKKKQKKLRCPSCGKSKTLRSYDESLGNHIDVDETDPDDIDEVPQCNKCSDMDRRCGREQGEQHGDNDEQCEHGYAGIKKCGHCHRWRCMTHWDRKEPTCNPCEDNDDDNDDGDDD